MKSQKVIIIGGGAAGFFAAITCARYNHNAEIILLEKSEKLLSKVKISGGGRCNVTHACFDNAQLVKYYPRGGKELKTCFVYFSTNQTMDWFESRGVKLKTEADGRMFPVTDDSETIVEALMFAAKKAGVHIRTNVVAQKIEHIGNKFELTLKNGESLICDRLLLATGSSPSGYAIARSLGHELEPPVPSLFTFNVKDTKLHELAGVSVNPATVKLLALESNPEKSNPEKKKSTRNQLEQSGALLITHWGLSGPAVLKLSSWAARELYECHYQAKLAVNWIPALKVEAVKQI